MRLHEHNLCFPFKSACKTRMIIKLLITILMLFLRYFIKEILVSGNFVHGRFIDQAPDAFRLPLRVSSHLLRLSLHQYTQTESPWTGPIKGFIANVTESICNLINLCL